MTQGRAAAVVVRPASKESIDSLAVVVHEADANVAATDIRPSPLAVHGVRRVVLVDTSLVSGAAKLPRGGAIAICSASDLV